MAFATGNRVSRRNMLAMTASVPALMGARGVLAQEAAGQPMPSNADLPLPPAEQMRWAIVGLGNFAMGQVMPGFRAAKASRMTAFVSGNAEKARQAGAALDVARFYDYANYDAIAQDEEIDCVYIALPVGLHAEYTIRALEAGKHVLCEKPMASSAAEAQAMVDAAAKARKQLGVAYRVQFEPTNLMARRLVSQGAIGTMRHIRCDHGFNANPDFAPHRWRLQKQLAGGGSMFDIGIYGINTALMMMPGDKVVSVTGKYVYPRDDVRFAEVEGGVDWQMEMASGCIVTGSSSYSYSPYVSSQSYMGSAGRIFMDPATTYYDNRLQIENGDGRRLLGAGAPITQFAAQVDAFSLAAREGRAHATPGEMGLRDMQLIEAIYQSADAGGQGVRLGAELG